MDFPVSPSLRGGVIHHFRTGVFQLAEDVDYAERGLILHGQIEFGSELAARRFYQREK